jgi:hypothetical protein
MILASPPRLLGRVAAALIAAIGTIVPSPLPAAARAPGVPRIDASGIVWLCRPGLAVNPCMANLDTTVVLADGSRSVKRVAPAANPAFDCFYVYPTVSRQQALNANLQVDPEETAAAMAQAARFSQVCRVWSPM